VSKLENQWIEIFRAGDYASQGKFTEADLDQIVLNYQPSNPEFEDAPATIGHSDGSGAPAWAWWSAIKREGKLLLGKMKDVQPQFEEMVQNRMFPKRSIGLVKRANSGWNLQHVAFLGAKAPQVKGLADCKFSDRTGLMHVELEEKFDIAKAMKGVNSRYAVDENSAKLHAAVTEFCEKEKVDYLTGCFEVLKKHPELEAPPTTFVGRGD
jgi:hypothetical protein